MVTNWFNKRRGLAFGVIEAGFSVGQMVVVPASLFFMQWFDWKMAVAVLGLFLLIVVFPVMMFLLKNHPAEKGLQPIGGRHRLQMKDNKYILPAGNRSGGYFQPKLSGF